MHKSLKPTTALHTVEGIPVYKCQYLEKGVRYSRALTVEHLKLVADYHKIIQSGPFAGLVDEYLVTTNPIDKVIDIHPDLQWTPRTENRRKAFKSLWCNKLCKYSTATSTRCNEDELAVDLGSFLRDTEETVIRRALRDREFAQEMVVETDNLFRNKEYDVCRRMMQPLIDNIVSMDELALQTGLPVPILANALFDKENKRTDMLAVIISALSRNPKIGPIIKLCPPAIRYSLPLTPVVGTSS